MMVPLPEQIWAIPIGRISELAVVDNKLNPGATQNGQIAFDRTPLPSVQSAVVAILVFVATALPAVAMGGAEPNWLLQSALLGSVLAVLSAIDLRTFRLPDYLTLPLLAAGLMLAAGNGVDALLMRAAGTALGFCMLQAVAMGYHYWRRRPGLGFGDVKLMAASGAWVGADHVASVILIACGLALLVIIAAAAFGRDVGLKRKIPFGPALAAATWLVWLYGGVGF